uniref:Tyrosine-protein phosphatase domain-containing protein n=1 Tax=Panagrolaimus sp. JU765 TaxID=591449 RepID=A0AC34RT02_9BILA
MSTTPKRTRGRTTSVMTANSISTGPAPGRKASTVRRRAKVSVKDEEVINDDGTQMEGPPPAKTKKRAGSNSVEAGGDEYDKALAKFVKKSIEIGCDKLVSDFNESRAKMRTDMPKTAFDANVDKNRYKDVICIDETRVVLKWPPENPNDYIHANWVNLR